MSYLIDFTRNQWLNKLNEVNGSQLNGFAKWIENADGYSLLDVSQPKQFTLECINDNYLNGIAADYNRMCQSTIETLKHINDIAELPKSKSWQLIKLYYASFYSAHSLLRLFGISLTQLDENNLIKLRKISKLFDNENPNIEKGFYIIKINGSVISFKKFDKKEGGSHEVLWKTFLELIKKLSVHVLSLGNSLEYKAVYDKLDQLSENLTYMNSGNGNWLSKIRNEINYKNSSGVWYPYTDYKKHYDEINIEKLLEFNDPLLINLNSHVGKEMSKYFMTCTFIISFNIHAMHDLSKRCSTGKSFLKSGALTLKDQLKIKLK